MSARPPPAVLAFATLAAGVGALEALLRAGVLNAFIIPPPSALPAALLRLIEEEDVLERFAQTGLEALATGAGLALVGIALGALLAHFTTLRRATETWVAAFGAAPLVLAYPLFLVIFGRSAATIVAMGFAAGLAPVILKTVEGLTGVRPVLRKVARGYNLTPRQEFLKVTLPAALPVIFTGLRLGLIFALINIVGMEFLINFGGLGQLINELAERYDLPGTYAAILFVVLVSVLFFMALEKAERWLRPAQAG